MCISFPNLRTDFPDFDTSFFDSLRIISFALYFDQDEFSLYKGL